MEVIQSIQNPKVKFWYQLKNKKGRDQTDLYIIEGLKIVEEAIKFDATIKNILIEEGSTYLYEIQKLLNEKKSDINLVEISKAISEKLAETNSPQGVFAVVKKPTTKLGDLKVKENSCYLLLDEIQDPGNMGTIIRSADAAGVDAIFVGSGSVELFNPKVIRSAMGSIFHTPIIMTDLEELLLELEEKQFEVIGTSPHADNSYFATDLTGKVALLVGNEARGLSETRIKKVNQMVNIPIVGEAESLNVAMATTLVLYERLRQSKFLSK